MRHDCEFLAICTSVATALTASSLFAVTVGVEAASEGLGGVSWEIVSEKDGRAALTLKAVAEEGYVFSGWMVDGSEPQWGLDARNPSLSSVLVASNAVVEATFIDCAWDALSFDLADDFADIPCGEPVNLQLSIDSMSLPVLTFKGLPQGLVYDARTQTISGVPTTPCFSTVVVTGQNKSGFKFSQTFHASVEDLSSDRLASTESRIVLGEYYHDDFAGLFACADERRSTTLAGVPPGLAWNASWDLLYGTPTKTGVYVLRATARFLDGKSEAATSRIFVVAPDPADHGVYLDGLDGLAVGDVLESEDLEIGTFEQGKGISHVDGLPPGLGVETWRDDDGVRHYGIVGTVREAGIFTVRVDVVDEDGDMIVTMREVLVSDTPGRYLKASVSQLSPANSGTVSGGGAISVVSGAKVVAKAAKGYVFSKWLDSYGEEADVGEGVDCRNPNLTYGADTFFEFMELFALFAPVAQDAEISIPDLEDASFEFDADGQLEEEFLVESVSLPVITAKGLPVGVSIVPSSGSAYKLFYDSETAVKRPSPGRYSVVLTAKNQSGASASVSFLLTVGNISDKRIGVEDDYGDFVPGEEIEPIDLSDTVDFAGGETLTVSGLPRGLVFNKSANAKTGIEAYTITGVPTQPGDYTLTFTAKVVASESTNVSGRVSLTYETATATAFLTVLPYPTLSIVVDDGALEAGNSVSGGGSYKQGAKVTLKAKAAKGWVFAGWEGFWDVEGLSLLNPSLSVTTGSDDLEVEAVFVPIYEDSLSLDAPPLTASGFAAELEVGLDIEQEECATLVMDMIDTVSYPTVKVSGLPAGVKFSSSTFLLSGRPTKTGVYYVTVEAKNAGGYSFTRILRIGVLDKNGNPPEELEPENAAQIDFAPLEGLVTGTYYAKGDVELRIGPSPASGYKPAKVAISGVPAGLATSVEALDDELVVFFVGTPTKVARYAVTVKVTYEDKKTLASKAYLITEDGGSAYLSVSTLDESFGTVIGEGVYSAGATVKLSAKPKAKCVFSGWLADIGGEDAEPFVPLMEVDGVDFRTASVSFPFRPNDIVGYFGLLGSFSSAADDSAVAVTLSDATWEIDPEVASEFAFAVDSLSLPKISAKNLPKGVTVDLARGVLVYTPTDSVKSGVYLATITAQNQSKVGASVELEVFVANRECEAIGGLDPSKDAYHIGVGVSLDPSILAPEVDAEDGWKLSAAGLPAGLKLVQDKATGAYSITGVPTAKDGYYTVTFTASKKGEKNQVATVTLKVEELPDWSVGTFDGAVWEGTGSGGQSVVGQVSASVTSVGKISGKMLKGGDAWTLAAASFTAVESPKMEGESPSFLATVTAKCGKLVETNVVMIAMENGRGTMTGLNDSNQAVEWTAWQNLWKSEAWKAYAKPFAKAQALTLYRVMDESKDSAILAEPPEAGSPYDTITLKFSSSGAVTATGKFIAGYNERTGKPITYSATCSAVLIPENGEPISDKFAVYLYFPPKVSSFDGCTIEGVLEWNGEKFSLSE